MENNKQSGVPKSVDELLWDKDNPPWNTAMAIFYWLFSVLAIVLIQAAAVLSYASYSGISLKSGAENPAVLLVGVIAVLPAHLLTLAVGWMLVTKLNTFSFGKMLGMEWGGFRWWHVLLILVAVFTLFVAFTGIFGEQVNDFERLLKSSRATLYAVALIATFSAPIVEEVVYRGVLYSAVQRTLNTTAAVILISVFFAGVHVPQYWGDFATISSLLSLSIVLTLVRVYTGNLLPCIALHFVFNGIQTTVLVLEPWIEPIIKKQNALTGFLN